MSFWNRFKKNFSSLGGVAGFVANPIGSLTTAAGSALASNFGNGNIEDQWDLFKNGKTNQANMAMNQANIDYQNQYNQQIWNREDTSYQRTLKDMASVGMSPLAMSGLNGAGGSTDAPNYMFGWSDKGASQAFGEISNIASQLASIKNLTAQNSLIGEQAKKQGLENEFLKDQLNYYRANGFVNGQGGVERGVATLLGALGSDNPVYSSGEDGLSFNNIADALRKGIKDGSVQKSITSLLGDVAQGAVDSIPQVTVDSAKIGRGVVKGVIHGTKEAGAELYDELMPEFGKKMISSGVDKVKKTAPAVGKSIVSGAKKVGEGVSKAKNFVTDLFKPKPGSKKFSKQQADARKARRGK